MEIIVDRELQFWDFCKSHSVLLLLSPKANRYEDRASFVFKGVRNINLPTYFFCKKIVWDDELEERVYYLHGEEEMFSIKSLTMAHHTDELEYYDDVESFEKIT